MAQVLLDHTLPSCATRISRNGRYVFKPGPQLTIEVFTVSNPVRISRFSVATKAQLDGDQSSIVSILLDPHHAYGVLVVCSNGVVTLLDYRDGRVFATFELGLTILFAELSSPSTITEESQDKVLDQSKRQLVIVTKKLVKGRRKPDLSHVTPQLRQEMKEKATSLKSVVGSEVHSTVHSITYSVELVINGTSSSRQYEWKKYRILKTRRAAALAVSSCTNWIGVVIQQHVYILRRMLVETTSSYEVVKMTAPEHLTSISFPSASNEERLSFFATGSEKGRIAIWHALDETTWPLLVTSTTLNLDHQRTETLCPTSILHWHSDAVHTLQFSQFDRFLLSAGKEGVLVRWNMLSIEGQASKEFLPRLGGELRFICDTPSNSNQVDSIYTVTRTDGEVLIIDSTTLSLNSSLSSTKQVSKSYKNKMVPIATLGSGPSTTILLPSSNSAVIQAITMKEDGHAVTEIEVAASNRTRMGDDTSNDPVVTHIGIGDSDSLMVTIDTFKSTISETTHKTTLKVWIRTPGTKPKFSLVARVSQPHAAQITSLACSTTSRHFVTTSRDGWIKCWQFANKLESLSLQCLHSVQFRAMEALASSYCSDSSLVAVMHSRCVSIWDAASFKLLKVVAVGPTVGKLTRFAFGDLNPSYIVLVGTRATTVFDIRFSRQVALWNVTPHLLVPVRGSNQIMMVMHQQTLSSQNAVSITDLTAETLTRTKTTEAPEIVGFVADLQNATYVEAASSGVASPRLAGLVALTGSGSLEWHSPPGGVINAAIDGGAVAVPGQGAWAVIKQHGASPPPATSHRRRDDERSQRKVAMAEFACHLVPSLHLLFADLLSLDPVVADVV